jgi:hypothetical protein
MKVEREKLLAYVAAKDPGSAFVCRLFPVHERHIPYSEKLCIN